jgi:hypothetical protein
MVATRGAATGKFQRQAPAPREQSRRVAWGVFMGPLVGRVVTGRLSVSDAASLYTQRYGHNEGKR